MASLTKQHFQSAADMLREWKTGRDKMVVEDFLCSFFRQWNSQFDEDQFRNACGNHPPIYNLKNRKNQ